MKLAIFDLDGTLSPQRPCSTSPFQRILLPAVVAKLSTLKQQGVFLAVATNQGGVSRRRAGRITVGAALAHFRWLQRELGLHAVRFATIGDRKKPNPVMLVELMNQFNAAPHETLFVGDTETDRQAAASASVPFIYAEQFFSVREAFDARKQDRTATFRPYNGGGAPPLAALPG